MPNPYHTEKVILCSSVNEGEITREVSRSDDDYSVIEIHDYKELPRKYKDLQIKMHRLEIACKETNADLRKELSKGSWNV
jgi:hypothetical protein